MREQVEVFDGDLEEQPSHINIPQLSQAYVLVLAFEEHFRTNQSQYQNEFYEGKYGLVSSKHECTCQRVTDPMEVSEDVQGTFQSSKDPQEKSAGVGGVSVHSRGEQQNPEEYVSQCSILQASEPIRIV